MSLLSNLGLKISNILYRNVFYHLGYGRPNKKTDWENAFAGGYWNFLESQDEAGRYKTIIKFVLHQKKTMAILDVGCGKGVLYQYLKQNVRDFTYIGVDISENAVKYAQNQFPEAIFRQMDFDKQMLNQKFDLIIFNETLEYFQHPLTTLHKCREINLATDGRFIISMYKGHNGIWKTIGPHFKAIAEENVRNDK